MKSNMYKVCNNAEWLRRGHHTLFLDNNEFNKVTSKLKKDEYKVYYPYQDAEKIMLYTGKVPRIKLFKINAVENLKHQDVMGSLYALNVDPEHYGDIVFYEGSFYVFVTQDMADFVRNNLTIIGKTGVILEEVPLTSLSNYQRTYEELEIIVSSFRIDSIVSEITSSSRSSTIKKIQNGEVIVNYNVVNKGSILLRDNDIFSIRKHGKYKFIGSNKKTKSNNHVFKILKYV